MTKKEFIETLKQALEKNSVTAINDILADYEEHFSHGLAQGKTEAEIAQKLGQPDTIAKAYEAESLVKQVKDPEKPFSLSFALTVLGRLLVVAPFNFLMLLVPGIIMLSILAGGWAVALAMGGMAVAVAVVSVQTGILAISTWLTAAVLCSGFFSLCFSVAGLIAMLLVTKYFVLAAISYLQWNLKFILQK